MVCRVSNSDPESSSMVSLGCDDDVEDEDEDVYDTDALKGVVDISNVEDVVDEVLEDVDEVLEDVDESWL